MPSARKLAKALDDTEDAAEWAKAADQFKKTICDILKQVKQIEGGTLPDDLYKLWAKHGCI
jgi:hypothetical protein